MKLSESLHKSICIVLITVTLFLAGCQTVVNKSPATEPVTETSVIELLNTPIDAWPEGQVILSKAEFPPDLELPPHTHPGEEVILITEGEAIVWLEGQPDVSLKSGDAFRIPFGVRHTAVPGPNGVKVLIFRVHPEGEPVRLP